MSHYDPKSRRKQFMTIRVAHDFNCPWCWVGLFQAQRLEREFGVTIEWVGYELFPKELEWDYSSCPVEPKNKPKTPGRFAIHSFAEGIPVPQVDRPFEQRTFNAHQAVEYAKLEGVGNQLVERLYRAHWEEGKDINALDVLEREANGLVQNVMEMLKAIEENRFDTKVVDFDEPAFGSGVYNLPTFFVGEERLAEQPYRKIKAAMEKLIPPDPASLVFCDLVFMNSHADRPFTFINMVTTIDGKIITGERGEPVTDLGSANDHKIMRRLEQKADAVLSGGTSVRASGNWNPETVIRIAITRSGDLPYDRPFFTQGKPIVMYPEGSTPAIPDNIKKSTRLEMKSSCGTPTRATLPVSDVLTLGVQNRGVESVFSYIWRRHFVHICNASKARFTPRHRVSGHVGTVPASGWQSGRRTRSVKASRRRSLTPRIRK